MRRKRNRQRVSAFGEGLVGLSDQQWEQKMLSLTRLAFFFVNVLKGASTNYFRCSPAPLTPQIARFTAIFVPHSHDES